MSALAFISGTSRGAPATHPTRNGGQVTFFKLRVVNGAALEWWDVATFSDTAREELDGLSEGDALSAVGILHVELVEYRDEQRIKRSLTADRVLALKPKPKEAKPRSEKPPCAARTEAVGGPAPGAWKRAVGIAPGKDRAKDAARTKAIRRWPAKAPLFARKRDDGRAEAALIAVAGLMREALALNAAAPR
ncbi:MAG: hypothetical protein ACLPSW_29975 [Roseiarcus sp.]